MAKVNPYDVAYELAGALAESDEMKELRKVWREVSQKTDRSRILEEFRQVSQEVQTFQMTGRRPRQELETELNRLMDEIRSDPQLRQYMEAETRVGRLIADITRILGEPLEEMHKDSFQDSFRQP